MSFALGYSLRTALLVMLGCALLTGCIVVPVGRARPQSYQAPAPAYAEPAYPSYPAEPAYPRYPAEPGYGSRQADVRYGTVAAIEPLGASRGGSSGAGAITGGLIGGLIGHEIGRGSGGRRGDGAAIGTMIGAFGGAVIGDQVERDANRGPAGFRVWIRLDGGGEQSLQLPNPGDLRVGDRVRFVNGQMQRL